MFFASPNLKTNYGPEYNYTGQKQQRNP